MVSHQLQVVHETETTPLLTVQSVVKITGSLKSLPSGKKSFHPFEFIASSIEIISQAKSDFPSICPDGASRTVQLDQRHMYLRDQKFSLIMLMMDSLTQSIYETMHKLDYTQITPPAFAPPCEGGSSVLTLEKYPATHGTMITSLSQSSQFYLEYVLPKLGAVFCLAKSYRGEKSMTRRHLTAFEHLEWETPYVLTLDQHIEIAMTILKGIVTEFRRIAYHQLVEYDSIAKTQLVERMDKLIAMCDDYVIMSHKQGIQWLRDHGIKREDKDGDTITYHEYQFDDDIPREG